MDKSSEQVLEKLHWPFPWLTGPSQPAFELCLYSCNPGASTHTDHALLRRDGLQIKSSSRSLHFLVRGNFTFQISTLTGSSFCLWDTDITGLLGDKTFQTMADLLLYKLRKLAWNARSPPCSRGIGNYASWTGFTQNMQLLCCYWADGEKKKEEGKRDEYMETLAKKLESIDLQMRTCIHTHSVKFRKSEQAHQFKVR